MAGGDWVKTGRAQLLAADGQEERWATLHLRCGDGAALLVDAEHVAAVDVTAVRCDAGRTLVVHSATGSGRPPLRLAMATEEEAEEWAAHLTRVCARLRHHNGVLTHSIWALTDAGDAFYHEPKVGRRKKRHLASSLLPSNLV